MREGWKSTTWGELASLEYGKSLRDYQHGTGEVPVYGTNGPIGFTDKPLCHFPSVIIGRKGAYRGVHYSDKPFFVIDTAFYLKPTTDQLDLKFAYYQLLTQDINSIDSGSAIPSTSREDFYNLEIDLPPLETQHRIAAILSALDEKIELNRQTNWTLEAIAQALFKEWFVDFNFPGATGEMQESERGLIPKGWSVGKLGDIAEINSGKGLHKNHLKDNGYPVLGANGCIGFTDNYLVDEELILTGRVGTLGTFQLVNGKVWISDNVLGIKSRIKELYYFIYFWIDTIDFRNLNRGSTQPLITKTDLLNLVLVVPEIDFLKSFDAVCRQLFGLVIVNANENISLAKTRDNLLPQLLNGDIEV